MISATPPAEKLQNFFGVFLQFYFGVDKEFIEILADIDSYEKYCDTHPDYPNNRAGLAIENIKENYKERLKKHDFLQESRAKGTGESE